MQTQVQKGIHDVLEIRTPGAQCRYYNNSGNLRLANTSLSKGT